MVWRQHIYVQLNNGSWINALINKIQLDTLYLQPFATLILLTQVRHAGY